MSRTITTREHPSALPGDGVHASPEAGLTIFTDGYSLQLDGVLFPLGQQAELAFRILGPGGQPVSRFDTVHERPLHLIVVRRDFAVYDHVHPILDSSGRWSIPLLLPAAGVYRVIADFSTDGTAVVLGADLFVAGPFAPRPDAAVTMHDVTDGGYSVDLVLSGGHDLERELVFRVSHDGVTASDLTPYLGAMGHLIALREGDLALQHVHPQSGAGASGEVRFHAAFPSPGRYRLFFEFATGESVHRTRFVLDLPHALYGGVVRAGAGHSAHAEHTTHGRHHHV